MYLILQAGAIEWSKTVVKSMPTLSRQTPLTRLSFCEKRGQTRAFHISYQVVSSISQLIKNIKTNNYGSIELTIRVTFKKMRKHIYVHTHARTHARTHTHTQARVNVSIRIQLNTYYTICRKKQYRFQKRNKIYVHVTQLSNTCHTYILF